ncbi:thiamine pyrophosphokinase [Favolaschia claudopus]|uniref:Thiamine pyrophosphokinase n=1 Tax=Favolaschia claudopus TaxID=2862362 RepID=A0AAW0C4E2_9AGAR
MDRVDTLSVHSEGPSTHHQAVAQALRLPGISTSQFKSPPSAFSRVPSIPQLYDLGSHPNIRDSVLTQGSGFTQSAGASSIYPPSTSTASGTESPPSPRSIAEQFDNDVPSFDPEFDKEYDGDDVSYRLRLLVKNNYFLPPAHAKPSASDFAASNAKRSPRPPTTPTFFDFFRKSRSKPPTPTGSGQTFDQLTPALRTPSDTATRSSSQAPSVPGPGASADPSGRVVVVREKMLDIATAAKQAEQEMNEVDVIDPTDAVDLPPPSAAYPFAVQASALHEMAQLADRLPPRPSAPSPLKALLHAAVNHSLNNSPGALSSPSNPLSQESSPDSDKRMLGQKIIPRPLVDEARTSSNSASSIPRRSTHIPLRVETPSMPLMPLPPPRRLLNPLYSLSQTSLPVEADSGRSFLSAREEVPASRLSDSYDAGVGRHAMLSPPLSIREPEVSSEGRTRTSTDTFYSEVEDPEVPPRPSMSSSIPENRPSLSIYSQPSPTTSAFQDAIILPPVAIPPRGMASPPPRVSSSLAHITPLSPPPRSSSLAQRIAASSRPAPPVPPLPSDIRESIEEILDPGPSTPPYPISNRRGAVPLSLEIPQTISHQSIRSAPPPSSPPSFFDALQNQPNAMDDLDSSSDEEDSEQEHEEPPQTPVYVNPHTRAITNVPSASSSSRSLLMRLGNHSTPYVSRSAENSPISSKRAVGNIPASSSFFKRGKSGKSDQGHGPPTSTFDFFQYTQQHPRSSLGAETTAKRVHASLQATVLFLVPYATSEADIQVEIEPTGNYLVAGVRGQPPTIKGRLYASVDSTTSLWQLEPQRVRRLSARGRTNSTTSTASTHSSYAFISDPEISSSFAASLDSGPVSDSEDASAAASPFGFVSPNLSSGRGSSKSHSHPVSRSGSPGHALHSLTSSYSSLESLHSNRSGRLLTLHLEKQRSGIWPSLISGPVPHTLSPQIANSVVFNASEELEHQYNMDPTSLTLIALELSDIRKDKEEAFEYFLRAWHQANTPSATMRLVSQYLPLQATSESATSDEPITRGTTPYYIRCMGGTKGLAHLYLNAGMLHLEGAALPLLTSSSSLSSLRVPVPHSYGESGADAWQRDREAAAKYFDRARLLQPTLDIPVLPPPAGSRDPSEQLQMPSIDLESSQTESVQARRRRKTKAESTTLFDNRETKLDDLEDHTWYLYVPGDLDSIRHDVKQFYISLGVPVVEDDDQDSTDLMKCVSAIQDKEGVEGKVEYDIVLLGGLSGRLDQTIHTLSYLYKLRQVRKHVFAVTDDNVGWVLDAGEHIIHIDHSVLGPTCGLLPVGVSSTMLSTTGLRWNLTDCESSFNGLVSTSNHLVPGEEIVWIKTSMPIWWTAEIRPLT